jgi:2-C-methyl-D-erythritol 4-phosphate cytidylyltransferase
MAKFHALIPAAGFGSRMESKLPKQYLPLLGRPILHWALEVFLNSDRIHSVVLVLSPEDDFWAKNALQHPKLTVLKCGGETRAESVLNGLNSSESILDADWVLVHDAARPGMTTDLLNHLLNELAEDSVGGLLAIPVADTLKRANTSGRVAATEPRENLWRAQTPQMFRYGLLKEALVRASEAPTDEAQAVEALGYKPKLVTGQLRNMKVTYPQDLALLEAIIAADKQRVQEKT